MRDNYIVVKGWMISELGLTGNELLVYAVIYGYSQDGENEYFGSLAKLSELLRLDRRTIMRVLQRLCDEGLVYKRMATLNNVQRCFYHAAAAADVQALDRGCATEVGAKCHQGQNATEVGAKCHRGRGKMPLQINKVINKDITKEKDTLTGVEKERAAAAAATTPAPAREAFKKPKVEEIEKYCAERDNSIDAQHFFDYYEACGWTVGKGKKMRDWRAAVRTWECNGIDNKDTKRNENKTRANRLAEARADIANALDAAERAYNRATSVGEVYSEELFGRI